LQTAIDKARPEAKGDPATTVTKIEQTENKDILMVTTADGNRVPFSKSAWSTGVYPDYDPANPGVFQPASEALKPQYPQQEEKPAAGILDGVTDYLKGLFKTKATREAEAAKVAAENQSREADRAKIAKANNDAIFGLPPQSSDPVYRDEYNRVKAEQDRRAAARKADDEKAAAKLEADRKAELINKGNHAGSYGFPADSELWKDPGYREAYKAAVKARNETNGDNSGDRNESKGKGGDNGPSDSNKNEIKETGDTKDGDTVYKAGNAKMV
jgi:hypothetical protein